MNYLKLILIQVLIIPDKEKIKSKIMEIDDEIKNNSSNLFALSEKIS